MAKSKKSKKSKKKGKKAEYPYREIKWHYIPLFQCLHEGCFFDSFDEVEIQAHIASRHVPPEPREPVVVKIKDRYGNVVREETV